MRRESSVSELALEEWSETASSGAAVPFFREGLLDDQPQ